MGEVRVFYAQGAPPSRGAISPAPSPSYLTQDRRALAGFGQAISQQGAAFLDHIQRVDVFNQTTEIEGATTESYSNFLNNLATDPDPSSYLSKYGEWSKDELKNINAMKNPEARRRATGWYNKQSASWYNQVQSNATDRVIRDSKAAFTLGIDRAIRDRDPDALARATTKAFQSGATGENEAALVLERGLEDIAVGRMNDLIEADPNEALIAIDESKEIPSERKSALRSRANTRIRLEQANANEELELLREKQRDEISDLIREGKSATIAIEESDLTQTEQDRYHDRERAETDRRLRGKEVIIDWGKYGELQDTVQDYYDKKISKTEAREAIDAEAGKTITETMAKGFFDDIAKIDDPKAPTNRASYKNAEAFIGDLTRQQYFWPSDIAEDPEDATQEELREGVRQNNITGLRVKDEFRKWLETQEKEPTDEQITDKVNELTQPFIEEKAAGRIERVFNFWLQSPFGILGRKVLGVEKEGEEPEGGELDLSQLTDEELDAELEKLK